MTELRYFFSSTLTIAFHPLTARDPAVSVSYLKVDVNKTPSVISSTRDIRRPCVEMSDALHVGIAQKDATTIVGVKEVCVMTDTNKTSKQAGVFELRAACHVLVHCRDCLLYTSPSPRDGLLSRMPSSA